MENERDMEKRKNCTMSHCVLGFPSTADPPSSVLFIGAIFHNNPSSFIP
jgi:hypothetical protein